MTSQAKVAIVGGAGEMRGEGSVATCGAIDATSASLMSMHSLPDWLHSLSAVMRCAMRRRPFGMTPLSSPPSCGGAEGGGVERAERAGVAGVAGT